MANNPITQLADMLRDLPGEIGGVITGIREDLTDILSGALNNLITSIDDIFKDTLQFIYNLPRNLIDSLTNMFKDPQFWSMIFIFLTLTIFSSGLSAAVSAPLGLKGKAFMEGAGLIYGGWNLDFIVKTHRFLMLVSPKHREVFAQLLGDLPERLNDAGIDLQYAGALFQSTLALSDSFGAMIGQDWEASQTSWGLAFSRFAENTGETLSRFGENPSLMIDWFDDNVIIPRHNEAANFMNNLSDKLGKLVETTDKTIKTIQNFRKGLSRVARDLDNLYDTNYEDLLDKGLIGIDEIIYEQWEITKDRLDEMGKILDTKTTEIEITNIRKNKLDFSLSLQNAGRLKSPNRLLLKTLIKRPAL